MEVIATPLFDDMSPLIECEVGQIWGFRIIESQLANTPSFERSKLFDNPPPKGAQWKREQRGKSWKS